MPQKNAKAMGKVVTTSPLNSEISDDACASAVARPEKIEKSPAGVQLGLIRSIIPTMFRAEDLPRGRAGFTPCELFDRRRPVPIEEAAGVVPADEISKLLNRLSHFLRCRQPVFLELPLRASTDCDQVLNPCRQVRRPRIMDLRLDAQPDRRQGTAWRGNLDSGNPMTLAINGASSPGAMIEMPHLIPECDGRGS